uniref:Homoserine O-acetyltransferase n=1 Tax=Cyanothece sp. (strain PCC 7425 / ATCC 29141) TaxID=395961 RepID=B8HKX0_CYAP4
MNYQHFISPHTQFYRLSQPFHLESGKELLDVQVAYRTWGQLNAERDNAVLVCHAFTGWADLETWWQPLLGSGRALDPDRDFIICSNILGSCYGTTGPTSINPSTGQPYGPNFPAITVRDMVYLQARLLEALGIDVLQLVIGGSLGGMQVLEWAVLYPDKVQAIAPIAVSGRHSAWCIALSEAQRQAIYADPHWQDGYYSQPPAKGLAAARMMAMNTYRSWHSFDLKYGRNVGEGKFAIADYLQYQGQKLVERFDANTYITLSQAMDTHDLSRPDQDYSAVLGSIRQPALIVGINSDILYPPVEQEELARHIPQAELSWLNSPHGHDGFLIDMDELNHLVLDFRHRLQGSLFRLNGKDLALSGQE